MCDVTTRARNERSTPRPKWGKLWIVVAFMLTTLAVLETSLAPSVAERVLECGLTLGGFGAIAVWARRNRAALDCQDWCECAGAQVTMRVIPSRRVEPECSAAPAEPARTEALEEVAR